MPNAYTSGKLGLIEPQAGGYSGTWDQPLFANWQTIEAALSGQTVLTLSSSDVTLTIPKFPASTNPPSVATSAQNLNIVLLGTLTANVFVNLPANTPGMWIVYNGTTSPGNFNVSIRSATPGSNSIVMPRGYNSFIQSNGANVAWADGGNVAANTPNQTVPAGVISAFGGYNIPSGYLECDGSVYAQSSYPALYAAISTYWNAGNEGSGNFRVPNLRNMFLRGWDPAIGGVGLYEADDFKSHTHTANVNDQGHVHGLNTQQGFSGGAGQFAQSSIFQGVRDTLSAVTGITVTNATTGGTETRPVNKRVLYIIKT